MKRALLVGINYVGSGHELHGCINDSNNMKSFLTDRGFTDIRQVLEADATTAGIVAALNSLVSGVVPGDVIVFHYSGHGSQLPSSAQPDGYQEIICPVDLNWMDKVITDDTLRDIFNKVPNGVNTTVILDCCHSGTMLEQTGTLSTTKEIVPTVEAPGSRFWAPPPGIAAQTAGKPVVDWHTSRDVNATALLIAGCHANQTSADTILNGQPCGAATAALLKSANANSAISYRQLMNEMVDFMVQNKYTQVPELDGDSSLYDQIFLEPFSFVIPASVPGSIPTAGGPSVSSGSSMKAVLIVAALVILILVILLH